MRALLRVLLRAFPRDFRARFGREVLEQAEADLGRAFGEGVVRGCRATLATWFDLVRAGLAERASPAWRDGAHAAFGDERRGDGMMGPWIADLRHAARALGRARGFTLAAVGTLALALGANAGIFSVLDAVLLRPLPYHDPGRLVTVGGSAPGSDLPDVFRLSPEFFVHYRDHATQLEDVATVISFTATVRADENVERLRVSMPSLSLFRTLGVEPELGRLPVEGEGGRVALISHGLWILWFGGDPAVIGRSYEFVGEQREVIGVLPPEFRYPTDRTVAWIPIEYTAADITPGQFGSVEIVGRMTADADHASLARELQALALRLPELYGGSPAYVRTIEQHVPVVESLRDRLLGPVENALWVLMAAVGLVLLVACANVAGLFTVRAEARGRDLAVRRALGAGRGALVRAQLAEAVVVALLAAVGAILLTWVSLPAFVAAAPEALPRVDDVRVSPATLAFIAGAAVLAALAFGLLPALRASTPSLDRLRDATRGTTRRHRWGRQSLVVAQTALALVLLVGSGLLLRSVQHLRAVDPGYDTEGILTFQFAPEQEHLVDGPSWARFHLAFMDRLRALPGVETVGIVENIPLDEGLRSAAFVTEERATDDPESGPRLSATFAGGDYFEAMGIEVLQGRGFTDADALQPGNVVLSRSAADRLWPDQDPLGRRVQNTIVQEWHTVVGVVEDVLQYDLRDEGEPLVYYPLVGPTPTSWALSSPGYVVRSVRPEALVPPIRELVREVAPDAPMYRVYTMETLLDRTLVELSFTMLTLAVAAGLALVLGAIGLYGVLSYVVAQRSGEIGVRMALGAEGSRVRRMVVVQGVRVVGLGIVLGLAVSFLAVRALAGLLYGVPPLDPLTFGGTALVMALVGMAASYVPALRASRVDPVLSMRGG